MTKDEKVIESMNTKIQQANIEHNHPSIRVEKGRLISSLSKISDFLKEKWNQEITYLVELGESLNVDEVSTVLNSLREMTVPYNSKVTVKVIYMGKGIAVFFPEENFLKLASGNPDNTSSGSVLDKHNHYKIDVRGYDTIDVYRLLELVGQSHPVLQHIVKKSLFAGKRGHKDFRRDLQDIRDQAVRGLEMLDEDERRKELIK